MDKFGTYPHDAPAFFSYEIVGAADAVTIEEEKARIMAISSINERKTLMFGEYTVAVHGSDNYLPNETVKMISSNPYLPEILKKQVRYMYGRGLYLYVSKVVGEGDDRKIVRVPVTDEYPQFMQWLNSWQRNGLPSYREYCQGILYDYYYHEGFYSQWHFNRSRRTGGALPIAGLQHRQATKCRLAYPGMLPPAETIEDEMLTKVIYNRWDFLNRFDADVYDRFDPANPFKSNTVINFVRDRASGEDIYPEPTSYFGLKHWIKGANLDAPYINSFLKNSFSARKHVKIPGAWIDQKQATLEKICKQNKEREQASQPLITKYEGVEVGTIFDYSLVAKLIDKKMEELMGVLGGEGKNQGKTFFTRTMLTEHGLEEWKIDDIPTNYADFIKSIIDFDKRAMQVILAGKGLDPAISNVGNEGVFNSGSQVYYAYLVYLDSLHFAEEICTEDLRYAAWLNFPELEKNNVQIGFLRTAPPRQQETTPEERMTNKNEKV